MLAWVASLAALAVGVATAAGAGFAGLALGASAGARLSVDAAIIALIDGLALVELSAGEDLAPRMVAALGGPNDLLERPGAYIFVGNGDTAGVHHPAYDFNDRVLSTGATYWVKLAQAYLRKG